MRTGEDAATNPALAHTRSVQPRRSDIQWLRAIAALSIVLWHSDLVTKHVLPGRLTDHVLYEVLGGFGVELFFLLSGFSICMQVERPMRPGEFLRQRAFRIYPLYWVFTGAMLLAYAVNPNWPLSARAGQGTGFVVLSWFALPQAQLPLLPVGWTLEPEFIFYLLVAAAMATGLLSAKRSGLGWLLVAFGLLGFAAASDPAGGMVIFEIVNPYMAAFGIGWLLRCHEHRLQAHPLAAAAPVVGGLLLLATLLPPREAHCALRMAVSLLLLMATMRLEGSFRAHPRIAGFGNAIGNASFSIYLSHWFVLSVAGKIVPFLPVQWLGGFGLRAISLVAAVGVGLLVHSQIEARLARWVAASRSKRDRAHADREKRTTRPLPAPPAQTGCFGSVPPPR